jgi:hypothetical protein
MNAAVPREQQATASAERRERSITNELLVELIQSQLRFERRVMTQLEQLQAHVADLTAAQADATAKVDVLLQKNDLLISLAQNLEKQLVALGESGQITPTALSDLITSIDGAKTAYDTIGTKVAAESGKVDAELAADAPADIPPADTPPADAPAAP